MGCGNEISDWDDKAVQDSLAGKNTEPDPKILEETMPEVEKAIEERCVECLEENAHESQEDIRESLKDAPSTKLEKQDLEIWPNQEEREIVVKTGKELEMSTADIIFTPPIVGTPGVENMEEKIRDVMKVLHTSEIPPWFRDVSAFSKIMFVDQRAEKGITGPKVAEFNIKTKVLHVYRNQEGKFPSVNELREILPHEVFHANRDEFMKNISDHKDEWIIVNASELRLPSEYFGRLEEAWRREEITTEIRDEELAAEWYRRYITGQCSEKTASFFDKYFSE